MTDGTQQTDGKAGGSVPRGVLAGLCGSLVGIPAMAIGFVVAAILKQALLGKLMGHEVDYDVMQHGAEAFLASVVLAFATGGIGAFAAAIVALKLVRDAARKTFFAVMGIGLAVILAAAWSWLKARLHVGGGTLIFSILLAFAGALIGMIVAAAVLDEEKAEADAAAAPDAG
ncbi:MAG TPA: hypothetical protein VFW19_04195 [Allosphingosinicella sp.]|nr:hypothetical protein [Allosphingosinicella sp.]